MNLYLERASKSCPRYRMKEPSAWAALAGAKGQTVGAQFTNRARPVLGFEEIRHTRLLLYRGQVRYKALALLPILQDYQLRLQQRTQY